MSATRPNSPAPAGLPDPPGEMMCPPFIEEPEDPSGALPRIRAAARGLFLATLGRVLPPRQGPFLRALLLHGVSEQQAEPFETMLRRLQQFGEFVETATCLRMLEGKMPIERRYFHLTFDDGYRSTYLHAFPTLRRLQIPAGVFIITGLVGAGRDRAVQDRMSWDELQALRDWGFEVGSHTRTHARLAGLPSSKLTDEIAGSKAEIENKLACECKYFAWPFGRLSDVDENALWAISKAGYQAAFSGVRGRIVAGKTSRLKIPRHHLEPDWPWPHIKYFASGWGD